MSIKNGSDPEFEEGASYVIKNFTISKRYGRPCIFVNRDTRKFKTSPLAITEEAEKTAKEALCPPSPSATGEEEHIFSSTGYWSLQGTVEKVQVARMTRGNIPILDLRLRCGTKLYNISLWREEALVELYVSDKVEVTHLKGNIQPNGGGKFDSSNYMTVKIVERQIVDAVLTMIGVSEEDNMIILLDSEMEDYAVPSHFYKGNINDLVQQLPISVKVQHINNHVLLLQQLKEVQTADAIESPESLDVKEAPESLDVMEAPESLDVMEAPESLDVMEAPESLDVMEAPESLGVENTE
ncbi:hypothetical protein R3I93_001556 [Phoxinus phoxinus]|uniref:Uncharacterized protein n=1 Tax=Phoxinus phoxinus TaxID=58324 RepID=A0AAN9DN85_9TELE